MCKNLIHLGEGYFTSEHYTADSLSLYLVDILFWKIALNSAYLILDNVFLIAFFWKIHQEESCSLSHTFYLSIYPVLFLFIFTLKIVLCFIVPQNILKDIISWIDLLQTRADEGSRDSYSDPTESKRYWGFGDFLSFLLLTLNKNKMTNKIDRLAWILLF